MFDFSSIIGDQINSLKPAVASTAAEFREFGGQLLERMDTLIDRVESEEFEEQRIYLTGQVAVSQAPVVATVPPSEEWLLETVAIRAGAADLLFGIVGAQQDFTTALGVGGNPNIIFGNKTVSGMVSYGGNGVIVQGNTPLVVVTTAAALDYRIQFVRKRLKPTARTRGGGVAEVKRQNSLTTENTNTSRHTGTWEQNR